MHLTLPYPPSHNSIYRLRGSRMYVSAKGREYHKRVREQALEEKWPCFEGRLDVLIRAFPPDRRKRDIQNLDKILFDALEGLLYLDDNQVDRYCVERCDILKPGRIELYVEEFREATPAQA